MPDMWPHFVHLLARSWVDVLSALSTSTLAVVLFSLAAPIVTFIVTMIAVSQRNPERTFMQHARDSLLATTIGFIVPLFMLACVFGWKAVQMVYGDHQVLAARVVALQNAPKPSCPTCPSCSGCPTVKPAAKTQDQCWFTNNGELPNASMKGAITATSVIVLCNHRIEAPFTIAVTFAKDNFISGQAYYSDGSTMLGAGGEIKRGTVLYTSIAGPAAPPYRFIRVLVSGNTQEYPTAVNVGVKSQ
jgi:hypothetical protein